MIVRHDQSMYVNVACNACSSYMQKHALHALFYMPLYPVEYHGMLDAIGKKFIPFELVFQCPAMWMISLIDIPRMDTLYKSVNDKISEDLHDSMIYMYKILYFQRKGENR